MGELQNKKNWASMFSGWRGSSPEKSKKTPSLEVNFEIPVPAILMKFGVRVGEILVFNRDGLHLPFTGQFSRYKRVSEVYQSKTTKKCLKH